MLYPVLRMADVFPDRFLVETAAAFDADRADSLNTRFTSENALLRHANERLIFGWGRYGRSRLLTELGEDHTITDGWWIITLGQFGLVGFLAQFGLLSLPVLRAAAAFRFLERKTDQIFLATLSLIVALDVIEQLPNASISSWSWFLAGILLGRSEQVISLAQKARRRAMMPVEAGPPGVVIQVDR
jgi:hypothetical protein